MSAMIFQERKHFLSTVQCATESSVEWLNRLQMAAMRCDFGDHLNEFLVTHFICGLASVAMFERLCGAVTKPIPLQRAFELAVQCERDLQRRASKECQTEVKVADGEVAEGAGKAKGSATQIAVADAEEQATNRRASTSPDDTDCSANAEPPSRPLVRRISRFLVSPSISIIESPPTVAPTSSPATRKISRFLITPAELPPIVTAVTKAPMNLDLESATTPPTPLDSGAPSAQPSETCSPVHKLSTSSTSSQCSAWEQLKIGLENITHAQVPSTGGGGKSKDNHTAHSPSRMDLLESGAEIRMPLTIEIGDTKPNAKDHHHQLHQLQHNHQHHLNEMLAKTLSPTRECGSGDKPKKKRVHSHPRFVLRHHDELHQTCPNNASTNSSYARFSYFEMDTIDMEYPRNLDSNIEMLGIEAENLEKAFAESAEEQLLHYAPESAEVMHSDRLELDDDDADGDENGVASVAVRRRDEDDPIGMSPCKRFFKYDKEVGYGSFKTVFRGLDTHTGVAVAWCELLGKKVKKAERLRFREEADMLKKLQNSNIVRFYDYWETSFNKRRSIVLVTELMLSGTLKSYLKRFKRINSKVFKSWCRQILKGLYFLHSRTPPIIHRDLKCDNIFITGTTGCVKIGDLGLATLKSGSFAKSVIGTPEFMAPEMYEERYDEAVDVYAFGMCMLEMATSEYPYNECTVPAAIYKKVVSGVKPASFDKVADDKVRAIIARCIMLNKDDRPSCKELLNSEFFSEDIGLQLQPFSREAFVSDPQCARIEFRLKLLDSKRRQQRHREDEAIQFYFELGADQPELVAKQMCEANFVSEEDAQTVAKLLHFQITSMLKERKERAAASASGGEQEAGEMGPGGSAGRPVVVSEPIQVPLVADSHSNGLMSMVAEMSPLQSPSTPQRLMSPTSGSVGLLGSCGADAATPKAKRTSRQSDPMVPKLQVLQVDGRMVECSMECMQKTITFKFDIEDVDPDEVASRLITQELLDETQRRVFTELVSDIIRTEEQRSRPVRLSFSSE